MTQNITPINDKKTRAVRAYNEEQTRLKEEAAISIIREYIETGEVICVKVMSLECKVSRSFFYKNPVVRAELERAKEIQHQNGIQERRQKYITENMLRKQEEYAREIENLKKQLQKKDKELEEANRMINDFLNEAVM